VAMRLAGGRRRPVVAVEGCARGERRVVRLAGDAGR
jgi:hypothetical protein